MKADDLYNAVVYGRMKVETSFPSLESMLQSYGVNTRANELIPVVDVNLH